MPCWRREREGRDERAGEGKDALDTDVEEVVAARATHHETDAQGASGAADGLRDEAQAGLGGGHAFDLEVDGAVEEEGVEGHGGEPICQTGRKHGAVEEQTDGDDWLGRDAVFDVDEQSEEDGGERERDQHEGGRPGDLVAAGVKAEEEQDEGDDKRAGAEEVDAFPWRFRGYFDWHLDDEGDEDPGCDD